MRDEGASEADFGEGGVERSAGVASDELGDWSIGGGGAMDDMARTLSTFGTRLDALVTSTTSYRSAITDRLVEYADTVNRLVKNQSADLAEHRSANQHLLAELQTGIASSESAVRSLADRIDDVAKAAPGEASQDLLAEVRSILDAQERLGQFLTNALDQFGDRVVERLEITESKTGVDSVTAALAAARDSDLVVERSLGAIRSDVEALRDSLVELASGDVVGALWDEVRALRSVVDDLRSSRRAADGPSRQTLDAVEALKQEMSTLRSGLTEGLVVEADDSLSEHLEDIRERVSFLAASLADAPVGPPAEGSASVEDVAASVEEIRTALRAGVDARPTPELSDRLAEIQAAVENVSDRVESLFLRSDDVVDRLHSLPTPDEAVQWFGSEAASEDRSRPSARAGLSDMAATLDATRSDVASIAARLDEGLVIDTDDDVADRVAALRDEVTAELEAVRRILTDGVGRPSGPSDDLEAVRAEIAALDGLPDAVAEAINSELVALRRRIKVRSEADVLTDEQLDRIAEAVADRLR